MPTSKAKVEFPSQGGLISAGALEAVSPHFAASVGLAKAESITVLNAFIESAGVQEFVQGYRAKYGLAPTQRSFFAYEATSLVVDAVKRAGSDKSEDIQKALKSSQMPSLLGGTYAMDEHNHPHTPMQIVGVRDGKVSVVGQARL